ncbi:MAG: LCP family protein [Oscillospiraceae bacterium]|nr:LCP family protein [Oscillospiraceae bacterium]
MSVRRKSNWYIYFIAFGIALTFAIVAIFAFKWYLFPENSSATGLTPSGDTDENFKPTAADSFNIMTMLSDGVSDSPELFIMIEYDAVENRAAFVILPNGISIPTEGRSLPNVYAAQGASKIVSVIESVVGVHCDSYIKMDRKGFVDLITVFGNVNYEILKSLIIRDGGEVETLNVGTHRLDAESMFRLAMFAQYDEGESYRFNCTGQMFADLVNQNFRNVDESLLGNYFNIIMENCETNLTRDKYEAHKRALINTVNYGVNPGEYYVPYGEYTEDGGFIIAENSIITIKQKAGLM